MIPWGFQSRRKGKTSLLAGPLRKTHVGLPNAYSRTPRMTFREKLKSCPINRAIRRLCSIVDTLGRRCMRATVTQQPVSGTRRVPLLRKLLELTDGTRRVPDRGGCL